MAPQNPSGMLAESIATFSQSAYKAFAEIESQCKSEVARATTQAKDAKTAREEALAQLHEVQLGEKSMQQEISTLRATLKQMEMTVTHQADTIAQLRREANQWKDQSKNWQEHFLRVEQERCALGTKVDELLAERLHGNFAGPVSPNISEPISQATTAVKRRSSSYPQPKPIITSDPESPTQSISVRRQQQRSTKKQPKPLKHDSIPTSIPPHSKLVPGTQTLIRRVQAVYEVKEESSEEELQFFTPKQQRTLTTPKHIKSEPSQRRRKRLVVEEEDSDTGYPEDSIEPSDAIEPPQDDDDDELLMGAADAHHEVYDTKRVPTTKRGPPQTQSASPKKRKRVTNARTGRDVKRKT